MLSFSEWGLKAKAYQYLVSWQCSVSDLGSSHHLTTTLYSDECHPRSKLSHSPCSHQLGSVLKALKCPVTIVPKVVLSVPESLALAWLYTNSDFCYTYFEEQFLPHFPKRAMAPVRKKQ